MSSLTLTPASLSSKTTRLTTLRTDWNDGDAETEKKEGRPTPLEFESWPVALGIVANHLCSRFWKLEAKYLPIRRRDPCPISSDTVQLREGKCFWTRLVLGNVNI